MSWRMDETYVKNKGKWGFLYRAVDKKDDTVDFKGVQLMYPFGSIVASKGSELTK